MKNKLLICINVFIIFGILLFVVIYSRLDYKENYQNQITNFENLTVAMESITENYLEGEQRICDVWANYINSKHMTLEDATSFISNSHVLANTMAHLIYVDTLTGLSTKPSTRNTDNYNVSYDGIGLFDNTDWISDVGKKVNISRAYTNPMNGKQSLAFINKIKIYDSITDEEKSSLLLRIVLVSELEEKWVFPQQEFKSAELSLINANGDYIIKDNSYKSNNFYEFYKSYNEIDNNSLQDFKNKLSSSTGSFFMKDSKKNDCVIAYTPLVISNGWVMLNYIKTSEISSKTEDWVLIGVSSFALLLLLVANSIYMRVTNKRLHQMALAAESANKAKTAFLSTMSHDIRTPMNAIIGLTTIAEKQTDDQTAMKDKLHKISLASNHLLTLINDVLDISKVESGKLVLNPISFSIKETSEVLINILQPTIKEKNLQFDFKIDNIEKEYLYADQIRLNQIYINLLSNAVKYTPENGSVNVSLKQEKSDKEGYIKQIFIVSDTGIGMSQDFIKVMYDSFSRQVDSRVNSIQGTGLGLAITKKMVDLMNGTIECESEEGKGTTFTVSIDLAISDNQSDQIETQSTIDNIEDDNYKDIAGMNVLIAEDYDINWEIIHTLLEMYNITSERAENGKICVDMINNAKEDQYDLIFMDVQMPEMNGIEATKEIRKLTDPKKASIPIIAMTADAFSENITECLNAGMNAHIAKPVDIKIVIKEIRKIRGK